MTANTNAGDGELREVVRGKLWNIPKLEKLEDYELMAELEALIVAECLAHRQAAVDEFIAKETIIEKFETLAEYIPKQFQYGYIEGMREEVDDFIEYLSQKRKAAK